MDPALLAVNHFCRAIGAQIHCRTIYGNPHDFASDLVAIERRVRMYMYDKRIRLCFLHRPSHFIPDTQHKPWMV